MFTIILYFGRNVQNMLAETNQNGSLKLWKHVKIVRTICDGSKYGGGSVDGAFERIRDTGS